MFCLLQGLFNSCSQCTRYSPHPQIISQLLQRKKLVVELLELKPGMRPFHCCSLPSATQRVRAQATCSPPKLNPLLKRAVAAAAFLPGRDRDGVMVGMCQAGPDMHLARQGTGEEAAPALGCLSHLMVVAHERCVTGFLLDLLQCGRGCNENKTCSFISSILQPLRQRPALVPDCSLIKAHLLCPQLSPRASGSAAGLSPSTSVLAGATVPFLG